MRRNPPRSDGAPGEREKGQPSLRLIQREQPTLCDDERIYTAELSWTSAFASDIPRELAVAIVHTNHAFVRLPDENASIITNRYVRNARECVVGPVEVSDAQVRRDLPCNGLRIRTRNEDRQQDRSRNDDS